VQKTHKKLEKRRTEDVKKMKMEKSQKSDFQKKEISMYN